MIAESRHLSGKSFVEQSNAAKPVKIFTPAAIIGIVAVSLVYFADIFLRCSHKLYWYDELFTLYLCQLPTLKATWTAVSHGADFNPPLFYLLTRLSRSFFGNGLIATRLPSTVGVWVFGLCLFTFVSRRAGQIAGIVAGIFPFFTLAQYYAYEARPHGLVLGWCGLALVCWQNTEGGKKNYLWSGAFAASLIAAAMSHVYGIYILLPFGLAELYSLVAPRRLRWGNIGAMCIVPVIAVPVFLPMLKAYRALFGTLGGLTITPQKILQSFLLNVYGPAIPIFLLVLAAFALRRSSREKQLSEPALIQVREIVLAVAFVLLPIAGVVGVKLTHGIFFDRYFLSSIAGWAILLGFGVSGRSLRSWVPGFLAACMLLLFVGDLGMAIHHSRPGGNFALREPASDLPFSPDPNHPMFVHASLAGAPADEDILVLRGHYYIYLFQYAPASMVQHLYYGVQPSDQMYEGAYRNLAFWTHKDMKITSLADFIRTRDRFLIYASYPPWQPDCGDCVTTVQKEGFILKSETSGDDGVLYAYERRR